MKNSLSLRFFFIFSITLIMTSAFMSVAVGCANNGDDPPKPNDSPAIDAPEAMTSQSAKVFLDALFTDAGNTAGWNMGNTFDAHVNGVSGETKWGNPAVTQALVEGVKNAGFKVIRIPITWMGQFGAAPNYAIKAAWLARIAEVVGWAREKDLKVIINIHHDDNLESGWLNVEDAVSNPAKKAEITAQFTALWKQIAAYFKNHGDYLIFEGMNEIHDKSWGWTNPEKYRPVVNEWNAAFVKTVRETGGNNASRYLVIPGFCQNPQQILDDGFTIPNDVQNNSRLIVSFHYYEPYNFTLKASTQEWEDVKASTEATFNAVKAKFADGRGIPVIIGEYGASQQDGNSVIRQEYMKYMTETANKYGFIPIVWDNGVTTPGAESHGYLNRQNGEPNSFAASVVAAIIQGTIEGAQDDPEDEETTEGEETDVNMDVSAFSVENGVTKTTLLAYEGKSNVTKLTLSGTDPWAALTYALEAHKGETIEVSLSMNVWLDKSAKVNWQVNFNDYQTIAFADAPAGQWVSVSVEDVEVSVPTDAENPTLYLSNHSTYGLNGAVVYIADFSFSIKTEETETPTPSGNLWRSTAYTDTPLGTQPSYANGNGTMQIDYAAERQTIDGFGGSDAWKSNPSGTTFTTLVTKLYSKTDGIGFSILRNRVPFRERLSGDQFANGESYDANDGFIVRNADNTYKTTTASNGTKTFSLNWNSWDIAATKALIAKIKSLADGPEDGLKIISTPWTPPNNSVTRWKQGGVYSGSGGKLSYIGGKDNTSDDYHKPDVGGSLKPEFYNDYADLLADYTLGFQTNMGHPLTLLSVQNEPDTMTDYESCIWDGTSIKNFAIVLGNRFALKNAPTSIGIVAAEQENFKEELVEAALSDADARTVITHVGAHQYEAPWDSQRYGAESFPNAAALGKRIWQTEMGQTTAGNGVLSTGKDIENALAYARMIHHCFTVTSANAWLYWWMWQVDNPNSDALVYIDNEVFSYAKRYYAVGAFSKFIRPGYKRVGSSDSPLTDVYASAYMSADKNKAVLVLINHGDSQKTVSFDQIGGTAVWTGAYRVSATEDLASLAVNNVVSGTMVTLPSMSITTLTGDL